MKKIWRKLFGKRKRKIWIVIEDISELRKYNILRVYGKKGCNIDIKFFNMSKENRGKATKAELGRSKHNEFELKSINTEVLWFNPLTRY